MVRLLLSILLLTPAMAQAQKYTDASGRLRVALAKQPFSPNGISAGPNTMANGGIQPLLQRLGVVIRVDEAKLTAEENTEYGG